MITCPKPNAAVPFLTAPIVPLHSPVFPISAPQIFVFTKLNPANPSLSAKMLAIMTSAPVRLPSSLNI